MPAATYVVEADWGRTGLYDHAESDISDDVLGIALTRGRDYASQLVGRSVSGDCVIDVKNQTGKFSRVNTASVLSGLLEPGVRIRVRTTAPSAATLWTGFLAKVESPGAMKPGGLKKARLTAKGPLHRLRALGKVTIAPQTDITTGDAIELVLDAAGFGLIADGTTNEIENPSAEVDTSSWTASGATLTRDAAAAAVGSFGFKLQASATTARHNIRHDNIALTNGQQAAVSCYAKKGANSDWCVFGDSQDNTWHRAFFNLATGVVGSTHGTVDSATIEDASGTVLLDGSVVPAGFYRLSVVYTHDNPGTGNGTAWFEIADADGQTGGFTADGDEYHYVDGFQFEKDKSAATPYCDGSGDGPGYSWAGAPHASASTREAGAARDTTKRSIETGQTTLPRWFVEDINALSAIQDIEETERGFLLEAADGAIVFEDRHHRIKGTHLDSQATFSDAAAAARPYQRLQPRDVEAEIFNDVTIPVRSFAEQSLAVLWTHQGDDPTVRPGETLTLWASYPPPGTPEGRYVDAWTTPVVGTDITQTGVANGDISVTASKFAKSMKLVITNGHASATATLTLIQARGEAVTESDPTLVTSEDTASKDPETGYGERSILRPGTWHQDLTLSQGIADFIISRHADPLEPIPLGVGFEANYNSALLTEALTRDISERITVVADNTGARGADLGVDGDYFIETIRHAITSGGKRHDVFFDLSPAAGDSGYWALGEVGFSELGETTRLAPP